MYACGYPRQFLDNLPVIADLDQLDLTYELLVAALRHKPESQTQTTEHAMLLKLKAQVVDMEDAWGETGEEHDS